MSKTIISRERSIVVCDSDPAFLSELESAKIPGIQFLGADTEVRAQHLIADRTNMVASVCVNPGICNPVSIPLIRFTRAHRPATPIRFLLEGQSLPLSAEDLKNLQVQGTVQKPVTPQQLVEAVLPSISLTLDRALDLAGRDELAAGQEAKANEQDMHPIDATSFLSGSVSYFDVYVKVNKKNFLKILKAGDQFDQERVASYLKKGVTHFYLRAEAQQYFVQFCDRLTEAILKRSDFSPVLKQQQLQNLGKETFAFLRSAGLSDTSMHSARRFVAFSSELARQLKAPASTGLSPILDLLEKSDHCSGTVTIVSLMLEALEFRDQDVIATIALGAFLHDIGLYLLPESFVNARHDELSPEDQEKYETHPILGADMLEKVPNLNPLVSQIVRQHHERRTRKGYPDGLGPGAIAPMAELVGIADLFQEMIERKLEEPGLDPLKEIEASQFNTFSFQTVEAFRKAFILRR